MKFLIVFALVAAASAAPQQRFNMGEIAEILGAIHNAHTNPNTAAALQKMLLELLGIKPPSAAIVEEKPTEIDFGPAIVEEPANIDIGPALVDGSEDISVGPAVIEPPTFKPFKGPLVQVIVNVESASDDVTVEQVFNPEQPEIKPEPVDVVEGAQPEIKPEPVDVVEGAQPEIKPDPVIVVENNRPELEPENINVNNPIIPDTAANLPDDLN